MIERERPADEECPGDVLGRINVYDVINVLWDKNGQWTVRLREGVKREHTVKDKLTKSAKTNAVGGQ
jgi:hypothetical protein